MWICLNNGFVSAVEDFNDKTRLLIRARRKEHLTDNFHGFDVIELDDADYRYRISISKEEYADRIHAKIMNIDYPNFKNSVMDEDLEAMYHKFWYFGYQLQA